MKIKTYIAATSKQALAKIVRELGANAIIISRKQLFDSQGNHCVEITASSKPDERVAGEVIEFGETELIQQANSLKSKPRNILIVLLALLALLVAIIFWPLVSEYFAADEYFGSIAVLSFTENGDSTDRRDSGEKIADAIVRRLKTETPLDVIPSLSTASIATKGLSAFEIGKQLQASLLVTIRLSNDEEKIRYHIELIDINNGDLISVISYSSYFKSNFAIQDEVSLLVENEILNKFGTIYPEKFRKSFGVPFKAFNKYREGRKKLSLRTRVDTLQAFKLFKEAISLHKGYVLAHVGLADSYLYWIDYYAETPLEYLHLAKESLDKALLLDDSIGEVYASRGYIKDRFDNDFPGAEEDFLKAIDLSPEYATVHLWYSEYLSVQGQHLDSITLATRALELDPENINANVNLAFCNYYAGQEDLAKRQIEKAMSKYPRRHLVKKHLFWIMFGLKEYSSAIDMAKTLVAGYSIENANTIDDIYQQSGYKGVVAKLLEWYGDGFGSYSLIRYNVLLGRNDVAKEILWKKLKEKNRRVLYQCRRDPILSDLRDDPEFTKIMKEAGIQN